jgi:hypothetical protein
LSRLQVEAVRTLARFDRPEARARLTEVAADGSMKLKVRVAACRALRSTRDLERMAANETAPLPLRTAAVCTLARIDEHEATAALERVAAHASPTIARRAREARNRKEG